MEADEVDAALQSIEQAHELAGIGHGVVDSVEEDVLERKAALTAEVVGLEELYHLGDRIDALGRHELGAQLGRRSMQADGEVAIALVEEALEVALDTHGREGDAAGAPCQGAGIGEQAQGLEHLIGIVERLAHTHHYHVGERCTLGDGIELVENLAGGEVCAEALAAGHAEGAMHLATYLRRHTQRGTVIVGDVDGLNKLSFANLEQVLDGAILRVHGFYGVLETHLVMLGQQLAVLEREIGHISDLAYAAHIHPFHNLPCSKAWHAVLGHHCLQFGKVHTQQFCLHSTKLRIFQ